PRTPVVPEARVSDATGTPASPPVFLQLKVGSSRGAPSSGLKAGSPAREANSNHERPEPLAIGRIHQLDPEVGLDAGIADPLALGPGDRRRALEPRPLVRAH